MLDERGFDAWAKAYDNDVQNSKQEESYPFAGYDEVLAEVLRQVPPGAKVLDLGFGTAALTERLYRAGHAVWGVDFSREMLTVAQEKMPDAHLVQGDFTQGLPAQWMGQKFGCILTTYAFHHVPAGQRAERVWEWLAALEPGGRLIIGDIAFANEEELELCKHKAGDEWDDTEDYLVFSRFEKEFPRASFAKLSFCAGVVVLENFEDRLTREGIEGFLHAPYSFQVEDCVDSTNRLCRDLALQGAPEGTAVIAGRQTAGRGRLGRSFYSPQHTGLYISILLRPKLAAEKAIRITTAAAVAVCEAIFEVTGRKPGIKWVNDLFLDGKKVCGILTEAAFNAENGGLSHAVLGIGVNVYTPEGGFPEELRAIAGSVLTEQATDVRNRLAAAILDHFWQLYGGLEEGTHMQAYRARSIAIGRQVTVIRGGEQRSAQVLDVDGECHLVVRWPDGSQEAVSTGEISIRL